MKLTRSEKAKRQREIVNERRRNGICIICGKEPMATNRDGTTSVRCIGCREQMARRKERYRTTLGIAPARRDSVEYVDFLETREFKRFARKIRMIIRTADKPLVVRDIKQIWPPADHRWLADALTAAVASRKVESFQLGGRRDGAAVLVRV